eukprot:5462619-Pyramimonas_sp.AAC.1
MCPAPGPPGAANFQTTAPRRALALHRVPVDPRHSTRVAALPGVSCRVPGRRGSRRAAASCLATLVSASLCPSQTSARRSQPRSRCSGQ